MKRFFAFFTLALIFSFIKGQVNIKFDLENDKSQTVSIKADITYYAFIKAKHGQKK